MAKGFVPTKNKAKMVWLGKGVLTRRGRTYKNGDVIPDGIDEKELAGLKKKGYIGNPVKVVDLSEKDALIEAQVVQIKKLQAEILERDVLITTYNQERKEGIKDESPQKG